MPNLWVEADRIEREQGTEALRRWSASLTADQRAAMSAQWDQFSAGMRELPPAMAEMAQSFRGTAQALGRVVEEIERASRA